MSDTYIPGTALQEIGNRYISEKRETERSGGSALRDINQRYQQESQPVKDRLKRAAEFREQSGFNIDIDTASGIAGALDDGYIDTRSANRLAATSFITEQLNKEGYQISREYVHENLDAITQLFFNNQEVDYGKQGFLQELGNSFSISAQSTKAAILGNRIADAYSWNHIDLAHSLEKELQLLQEDIARKQGETYSWYNPRGWVMGFAKSSVYTLSVAAGGFFGGGLGAFAVGYGLGRGQIYNSLKAAGVEHDTANNISLLSGVVYAGVEALSWNPVSGVAGTKIGQELLKKITGTVVNKMGIKGVFLKSGLKMGGERILHVSGEMFEESIQEIVDIGSLEIAKELQQEGIVIDDSNYLNRVKEAMTQAIGPALIFGTFDLPGQLKMSVNEMTNLRAEALINPSTEGFIQNHRNSEAFKDLSDEDARATLGKIHDSVRGMAAREEAALAEKIKKEGGLGEGFEERPADEQGNVTKTPEYRNSRGELYVKDYTETKDKKLTGGSYRFGDGGAQTRHNLYGHIDYRVDGDKVTIRNMEVAPHRRNLTDEFYGRFAKDFSDYDITWNPQSEAQIELRDSLVQNNRRGAEAGLNWFEKDSGVSLADQQTEQRVSKQFRERDPRTDPQQMRLLNRIVTSYGRAVTGNTSLDTSSSWKALGFDPNNIFTEELRPENIADYLERRRGDWGRLGITEEFLGKARSGEAAFTPEQTEYVKDRINGFITNLKKDSAKYIYLAKHGNFSTLVHEVSHAARQVLPGELLQQAETALGVADGKWTTENEEDFARYAERYFRTGEVKDERLKPVFDQIREVLTAIYETLKGLIAENKELKKVFDELTRHMETAQEGTTGVKPTDITSNATGGSPGASSKLLEGSTEADGYDDIDAWVKTLPEEQQRLYRENKALNEGRESLAKNSEKTDPKPSIEGVTDLASLKEKARGGYDFVRNLADEWARKWDDGAKGRPGFESRAVLKSDSRATEKHVEEETPYNQMLDMAGFTVVVKDFATLVEMAQEVRDHDAVVRVKDRYKNPVPDGYRDFLLNIKAPNGFIGEIQLNVEQMYEAKETYGGHILYEVARSLKGERKKNNIDETQYKKDYDLLEEMSDKFYGKAWGMVQAAAQASASSLDIRSPSLQVYTEKNGEGDKVLSAFTSNNLELLAQALSRHLTKESEGSSISGTSGTKSSGLPLNKVSAISASTTSIGQSGDSVNTIREQYRAAKRTEGWEDTKNIGGEELEGRWVLVEAETPAASHDEVTFTETAGFPTNRGKSVNDRDYRNDRAAQEAVVKIAGSYDGRALEGIVISEDGVVVSGNNRTMSGKLAARNGTDGSYIEALAKKARKYGFTEEQVRAFSHPRLVFETAVGGEYSTELFSRFNRSTRKSMTPLETAVKMTKRLAEKPELTRKIAASINEHETLAELYSDTKAAKDIFTSLRDAGLVGEYELPQYISEGGAVTGAGEDLLESVILGAVLTEDTIRGLEASKETRRKLVRGITPLLENKGMGSYSLAEEVNEAAGVVLAVKRGNTYRSVDDYAMQQILPGVDVTPAKRASIQIARALESGGQRDFHDWMKGLNTVMAAAAAGQQDMFNDAVENKETVLERYVSWFDGKETAKKENAAIIKDRKADKGQKALAAFDNAGIAREEETLYQIIGEQGATALDTAEEVTVRIDNLAVARQMEEAGKDAKTVRLATGWERGAEGKWKYEIPDIELKSPLEYGAYEMLADKVISKELFNAYPELADVTVEVKDLGGLKLGEYSRKDNRITLDRYVLYGNQKGVLAHEIQHAIQEIEGFAKGSNKNHFADTVGETEFTDELKDLYAAYEKSKDGYKDFYEALKTNKLVIDDEQLRNYVALWEQGKISDDAFRNNIDYWRKQDTRTPEQKYHVTAGEVEARNAQTRMGLTPRQRLSTLLADTEDIAREDQIFLQESLQQTQTLYQDAYHGSPQDETFFQEDMVDEAASYDSWKAFRDANEQTEEHNEADDAWYKSLWKDARLINRDEETLFQGDDEKADEAFLSELDNSLIDEAARLLYNNTVTELQMPGEGEDREAYNSAKELRSRVAREMPDRQKWLYRAVKLTNGELSKDDYTYLRGLIRKNPRDYRALFADLLDKPEWKLDLAPAENGEGQAELAAPERKTEAAYSAERLKRIAERISDPDVARGIEEGTVTIDDPRVRAWESGLEEGQRQGEEAVKKLESETGEDYGRLEALGNKELADLYRRFQEASEQVSKLRYDIERKRKAGELLTERYQKESAQHEADYESLYQQLLDMGRAYKLQGEVREAIARQEAVEEERRRIDGLKWERAALREVREIKKRLVKSAMRKAGTNVAWAQARVIKTIQSLLAPNLTEGLQDWMKGLDNPSIQELHYRFWSDQQFREKLVSKVNRRSLAKLERLMAKPWDTLTDKDKRDIVKAMPKTKWMEELGIEKLLGSLKDSLPRSLRDADGRMIVGEEEAAMARKALGEAAYTRLLNKPFASWTVTEMAELNETIGDLYSEGRINERARQEGRIQLRNTYRNRIIKLIQTAGIKDSDSPEEKEKKLNKFRMDKYGNVKENSIFNSFLGANMRRFSSALGGGIMTDLFVRAEHDALVAEERGKANRARQINEVMEKNKITVSDLETWIEIKDFWADGRAKAFTVDDLLFFRRAVMNEFSRQAVQYGNFSDAHERSSFEKLGEGYLSEFGDMAGERLSKVLNAASAFLEKEENKKFLAFAEAIGRDWDENGERLNRASIEMFNRPIGNENYYIKMIRKDGTGGMKDEEIVRNMIGQTGAGRKSVKSGQLKERQHISPYHQTAIETGLYKTWLKSLEEDEHLVAYGPLVQTLNAVFKGYGSEEVREVIKNRYGEAAVDYINDFIGEMANPNPPLMKKGERIIRSLRGKTATAYLAFRLPSMLRQIVTSPWPYLAEINPKDYLGAVFNLWFNPAETNKFIRSESASMNKRVADPMFKLIREEQAKTTNPVMSRIDKINEIGMRGLEMVDWYLVAPGWLAVYKREYTRLLADRDGWITGETARLEAAGAPHDEAARIASLSADEDIKAEAVFLADDAVARMQPSGRKADLAPIHKNKGEAWAALTQFQTSLSPIYQNIRYDLPQKIREKHLEQVIGMVTGYAMAGICLGLLSGLGDDDDDDMTDRQKAARMLFYAVTQLSDSVPVIGSDLVTPTIEKFLTGKRQYVGQSSVFPAVQKAFLGIASMRDVFDGDSEKRMKAFYKVIENLSAGGALYTGLPLSGFKDIGRAAGIGGKPGLHFNPWPLINGKKPEDY